MGSGSAVSSTQPVGLRPMSSWLTQASFGLRLLAASPATLVSGIGGMTVAVLVMLVQIGLFQGILHSQALIATLVRGDLVAMNRARSNLHQWSELEPIRVRQIAAVAGVERVMPIYEGGMGLRVAGTLAIRRIIAFAFPPDALPLNIGDPDRVREALKVPGAVLFDRRSRPIYGSIEAGRDIELDGQLHRVAGFVTIGPDIVNDGALVMSEGSWFTAEGADSRPIMAAIRIQRGADLETVRRQILQSLPADVSIMTPAEVRWREALFTMRAAPIGVLFGTGVLAGLVIGALTCYQVLFQLIMDRIKEFATLRAMGFSDPFLRRVVMQQAFALACPAFAIGLALSLGGYAYLQLRTALTIPLTLTTAVMVFALTLAMSAFAGGVAVRNLAAADPAALF